MLKDIIGEDGVKCLSESEIAIFYIAVTDIYPVRLAKNDFWFGNGNSNTTFAKMHEVLAIRTTNIQNLFFF